MKVLVTGCAGYIGSALVDRLLAVGDEVVGVDDLRYNNGHAIAPFFKHPEFTFLHHDVSFYRLCLKDHEVDAVVPLAAIVGAPACDRDEHGAWRTNLHAVQGLLDHLPDHVRVVFPNTNSGYGSIGREVTEEDPLSPISVYGKSKCEAEKVVLRHSNSVVLRLATVFGTSPRQRLDLMVNDFAAQLALKGKIEVYEPGFARNFVGIDDVVDAFLFFLDNDLRGVFNIGDPRLNMTKGRLAETICDALDIDRSAISIGRGKDPDARDYLVSSEKAVRAGVRFHQDLEESVRAIARLVRGLPDSDIKKMRNA